VVIFGYKLRKPWVKYVDLEFEVKLYREVVTSVVYDLLQEAYIDDLCDEECDVIELLEGIVQGTVK
jgi:hypothetical protein